MGLFPDVLELLGGARHLTRYLKNVEFYSEIAF